MHFRLLGPVEVVGPDGPARITAPREQIVLSMLLAEANQVVPMKRLIASIWDERAPRTARSQVQICVSTLRRHLAAAGLEGRVSTLPAGYLLQAAIEELDLLSFQQCQADGREAARRGDLEGAARAYRAGLAVWRGEPFAGLTGRVVETVATSLIERRLSVIEECIAVDLQLGRHHEVIGDLVMLVAEHPLRERLRGQLMVALYRAGRRPEALDAYHAARHMLVEDMGLEPGEPLRRLQQAILADAAELKVPAVFGAQAVPVVPLAAVIADFAGQDRGNGAAPDEVRSR
ncbi:hypothetical protein GCM10010399_03500 [Dactylosporangium fulvum]|uniref:AfsR/SARP family transcriptional regulator n=1 Tax=Dactylosporangium fulvum TaxID=53359 RepID=A0ABY5VQT2_9ACTN|nr:AfsR/SARP family transcriptional regulator [Dactylosporangium fulvum]UWP79900.1 AfsR/SARP family transcriptional regulator [Dactylosporangium fulvum]